MFSHVDYHIHTKLYESTNSLVYRAHDKRENRPVILKMPKSEYSTPEKFGNYQQEYQILRQLNLRGVIKAYGLFKYQDTFFMVLEDFGGDSLKSFSERQKVDLSTFLFLAITMAEQLGTIHAINVIHKDFNPSNIVYNPLTRQLKIVDFGIATALPRETLALKNPKFLEGTLAYMSPEQTGRMNRPLDYRTDLYSLGVTLYELITQRLPFRANDAMELVHCHLAKAPIPPGELDPHIPKSVSAIILRLMAKTAEERYQSCWGLKADLKNVQMQLQSGHWETFELGQMDVSDKFQLPQKLYGREAEIKKLVASFENTCLGDSELLLVAGYSGVGKSALVREIYKPITEKCGCFISGKFDQFQRNIPYSAVVNAFKELISHLLTESEEVLNIWRQKLHHALGVNGQVIVEVIPEIECIIGRQEAIPVLSVQEAQNRFNFVFQNFIHVFCQAEHPLVVFLDDLQWVDSASLKLMSLVMVNTPYLFLIGAYRDNEVSSTHPLTITLADLHKAGVNVQILTLTPLDLPHVNSFVADTLKTTIAHTQPLSELVLEKTGGNPFFMGEFLKTLYTESLIYFQPPSRTVSHWGWCWDLERIKARNITDNVVVLMMSKIQELDEKTQQILELGACIGNRFDLKTLVIVLAEDEATIKTHLQKSLVQGLIVAEEPNYAFVHDRVQQAAYALIPEEQRPALHWKIGQLLLKEISNLQDRLFEIVDHLNHGKYDELTFKERIYLAQLNLQAARKAKAATAYHLALSYLRVGIELLGSDGWQTYYDLTLTIYNEAASAAYAASEFDWVEQWVAILLREAQTILDQVKAYEIKIQTHMVQNQLSEALKTSLKALTLLGEEFPEEPTTEQVQHALKAVANQLAHRSVESLSELPQMADLNKLATLDILCRSITPAQFTKPALLPILITRIVKLSIQYGNATASADGYSMYGMILCGTLEEFEMGFRFGQLALKVLDQLNAKIHKTCVLVYIYNFISNSTRHARESLQPLLEAYQNGLETGELEFAAYGILVHSYYLYLVGNNLADTKHKMASAAKALTQIKQATTLNYHRIFWQTVLNLCEDSKSPSHLTGSVYNEEGLLPLHQQANDKPALAFLFFNKMVLNYLFTDYLEAVKYGYLASTQPYFEGASKSSIVVPALYLYHSLAHLARYPDLLPAEREKVLQVVASNQQKLGKRADSAPMNYQHKYDLVEAEKARVLNQKWEAAECYEKAILGAHKNQYLQEEALAYELAARFYIEHSMDKIAQTYLFEAYRLYQEWGAMAKVKQMEKQYPQWLVQSILRQNKLNLNFASASTPTTRLHTTTSVLDIESFIKASQALSREIVLSKLLEKMMLTVIENAGAQRGLLILDKKGQWLIEAEGGIQQETVKVLQSLPLEDQVPLSVIHYVTRKKEAVLLMNAGQESVYQEDAYIRAHHAKSILCTPIIYKRLLIGLIYLENNVTEGVFTPERLEVLSLLSSQMAISLENARFVEALEQARHLAESANLSKTAFLANVSHELRTPLNEILGYCQILQRYLTQNKKHPTTSLLQIEQFINLTQESVDIIQRGGEYLLNLVNDILDISQVENGQVALYPTDFHLGKLLKELADIFKSRAQQRRLSFVFEPADGLPTGVHGDVKRLRQILINLLSNAVKFTERGGIELRVCSLPHSDKVRFKIADTGVGIAPENLEKVFSPFEKLSDWQHKSEGAGLGLSITKRLLEMMGSTLSVETQLGKGSTFWFDLNLPRTLEWIDPSLKQVSAIIGYEGAPRHILLIDDCNETRLLLRNCLTPLGFEIIEAAHGLEGLEKLRQYLPDVILTDLVMPIMDGFELIRQIRKLPEYKRLPIIATSGSFLENTISRDKVAHFHAFLPKPVQMETLLQCLQEQLNLIWIYQQAKTLEKANEPAEKSNPIAPLETFTLSSVTLSAKDAARLFDLAMQGDYKGILDFSKKLSNMDTTLFPFAEKLSELAKQFDDDGICELVKPFLCLS